SLRDMPALIGEDYKIRQLVRERFRLAAVSWVGIERAGSYLHVYIHTARPGVVIGKRGADIEAIKKQIESMTNRTTVISPKEIKEPELDARLVAEAIAMQLERRIAHRRAIKRAIERTMQAGALGIKVQVKGRVGGAEIARREWLREGRVPLHTFSADIDYGQIEANTTSGTIGVKVWIYRKQFFAKTPKELIQQAREENQGSMPVAIAAVVAPLAAGIPAAQTPAAEGASHVPAEPSPAESAKNPAEQ
ncbi:MAG: 30S ribosomal protein S3, partial [candidate division NC10 bacterium]